MLINSGYIPSTEEEAVKLVDEKIAYVRCALKDIIAISDHYELSVVVLKEWDDYLRYTGRALETYGGDESYRSSDGGWYHSTCSN
jgi:hypothetical protein